MNDLGSTGTFLGSGAVSYVVVLLFVGKLACGGESSVNSGGLPATGGGASGGVASGGAAWGGGGATESGGTSSSGGLANTDPSCSERKPFDGCVPTCSAQGGLEQRVCLNDRWSCPAGHVPLASCDARSCARANVTCCHDVSGAISSPSCGADGKVSLCPSGSHELTTSFNCIPPSLGVTDCYALSGACPTEALTCSSEVRCGRQCVCERDASGALNWACVDRICG